MLPMKRAVSRTLKNRFPRLDYALWSWRNPGKTFKDYYAESVTAALEGKKQHASLGPVLKAGRSETALRTFRELKEQGISPGDTVVDYGCGTLRVGRSFIEFLEPDRYIGMDIDQRILDAGLRSLPAELLAAKRPVLEVISFESLARVAARRPKWVFAKGVLQHVPPKEVGEFFANVSQLVHAGAVAFIFARCAEESTAVSSKTWLHDLDQLQAAAARHGMEIDRPSKRRKFLRLQSSR
jgi:pentatricopeptide repeat protein